MRPSPSKVMLAGVLLLLVTAGCTPNPVAREGVGARQVSAASQDAATRTTVINAGTTTSGQLPAASAAAAPYCGITWGSGAKTRSPMSTASLLTVRTARQSCWDRAVFEFDGPVRGYSVRYANPVRTDGEGLNLVPYTAGGAWLEVVLRAPAYNETGPTFNARTGAHVANVVRYSTLRDVVFGSSFEGSTIFAVGVRARLPFRVSIVAGPGTHSRIIVDVAHRWQQ